MNAEVQDNVIIISELQKLSSIELLRQAEEIGVANANCMMKQELVFNTVRKLAANSMTTIGSGVVEVLNEGFAFIRSSYSNYLASPDDIYVSAGQVRKLGLRTGDSVECEIRLPKKDERYFALMRLNKLNFVPYESVHRFVHFDSLTPLYPDFNLKMECEDPLQDHQGNIDITGRIIDIISPIGQGQRALIVAPPKTGKTMLMQSIAHSLASNHPDMDLIVLLIDERPEEVTDMQRSVKGEVVSSTFDEPAHRHVQLAELVIAKARRMVEMKRNVVILLDSITRLARAYNAVVPSSGKVLTGGVDSNALQRPKRFFGAARNIEHGGSLSIIATALVDTGSKMDEVIFEEFKGTGNCEIALDRKLSEKRVFPSIDITKSGTRREELLVDKNILNKTWILRRIVVPMGVSDAIDFLKNKLDRTKNNAEFYDSMRNNSARTGNGG